MTDAAQPRAFTIKAFGAAYGIGRSKTFEEIRAGRLVAVKAGHATLIPAAAAEAWLANLPRVANGRSC